ncbi:MAG: DNA repair protein RadC [Acidobacteriota bacterium]|nr:DNA repair protein RadC [Acidobacteriota bacterium]
MGTDANQGHRQRLWTRFQESGFRRGFVHDYEKLEFLLTFVLPRRDTKSLARALLAEFGNLTGVIRAPRDRLTQLKGIGPRTGLFLHLLHELTLTLDEEELKDRDLLTTTDLVQAYLRRELAWEEAEYIMALFLDSRNRLLRKGRLFRGTVNHVAHYPRELAKEALACNAARVIIAHNHPSGEATPSRDDVSATHEIAAALRTVGVTLLDHFVVGRQEVVSLSALGLYAGAG